MTNRTTVAAFICLLAFSAGAFADEGKSESGKGKQRSEERSERSVQDGRSDRSERSDHSLRHGDSHFHRQGKTRIPNGHLPSPGECRVWYPDRPAGQQPPPFKCGQVSGRIEPGGWMLTSRPRSQEIEVTVYDDRRPGVVVDVGIFDAITGSLLRVMGAK